MTEDVKIRIHGDADGAVAAFAKVRSAATSAVTQLQRDTGVLSSSFGRLSVVVPQVGALIAGLSIGTMAKELMDTADAMDEMSERTGVSVERLAGLEYVGRMNNLALSDMGTVLRELNKSISEAGQGNKQVAGMFSQMGVAVKDSNGELRNAYDVLLDLAGVFPRLNQADQVAISLALLGRNGSALAPALAQGREEMERMIQKGQELNPITAELAKNVAEFNDKVDEVAIQIRSAMIPVLDAVIPKITAMSKEIREGVKAFGSFSSALWNIGTSNPFKTHSEHVKSLNEDIRSLSLSLDVASRKGNVGDVSRLKGEIEDAKKLLAYHQAMDDTNGAGGGRGNMNPLVVTTPAAAKIVLQNTGGDAEGKAAASKAAAEARRAQREAYEERISQLRTEMAAWRNNTEEQTRIADQMLAEASSRYGKNSQQYQQAMQEKIRIDQRAAEQRKQIEEDLQRSQVDASLAAVAELRAQADQELAMGRITAMTRLQMEEGFQQRVTEIRRAALVERLAILARDPDSNPVERARVQREIEEMEREHKTRMAEIGRQQEADKLQPGNTAIDSVQQAIEQNTLSFLTKQQSAQAMLRGIWRQSYTAFVQEMITKPLAAWMAGQARMTLATILGVQTRTAAEASGAAMTQGITASTAIKTIGIKAMEAAASVYASIAAIPIVGPFLAPAMAVAAIGAVGSFAGKIFSAEGGFDIPSGVNPMVQAHAREMILPAKHADVIRGLADGSVGAGGGDQYAFHFNTPDPASFERWLRGKGGDLIAREIGMRKRSNRG